MITRQVQFILLVVSGLFLINVQPATAQDECRSIEVKVETTAESGQSQGHVNVVMTKGDKKSAKFIFCEANTGKVLNENHFDKSEMDGLKKGRYLCIVNTNDCSKRVFFNID